MKRLWMIPALAITTIAVGTKSASAAYCGAISYQNCGGCSEGAASEGAVAVDSSVVDGSAPAAGGSYTVMRTVQETVYEQQEVTRYRSRNVLRRPSDQ
jgi:alkaline phosphatase